MTNWRITDTRFKAILARHDDPDNEEASVADTKAELLPYLRQSKPFANLPTSVLEALNQATTFHSLNQALDQIYDFADTNKIWLGF